MKLSRIRFQAAVMGRDGQLTQIPITGWEAAPGLVVHRQLVREISGIDSTHGWFWTASHIASGYEVKGGFRTRQEALSFSQAVAGITDWRQEDPISGMSEQEKRAVNEVRKRFGYA